MLCARSLTRSSGTHSYARVSLPLADFRFRLHAHPDWRAERLTLLEREERTHALHTNRMNSNLSA